MIVKQKDRTIDEFRFTTSPIHIGRHAESQVFLPDRAVSRHHAVIFSTPDGTWMVEDLDSANKTYLNGEPIYRAEINTDDVLRVGDFTIDIDLEKGANVESKAEKPIDTSSDTPKPIDLEDTLATSYFEPQVIVRKPDSGHAPAMRIPAKRSKDFVEATESICRTNSLDDVVKVLLHIATKQFCAYHAWCALRDEPTGPMICHGGKKQDGQKTELSEIKLTDKIHQAIEKGQFMLLPRIPDQQQTEKIHSVMIAPIMGQTGCFGILYMDNDMSHEHYTISDLDYLMLIAIHTAAILENF